MGTTHFQNNTAKNVLEFLDKYYDFFHEYYLHTLMLSIPHYYKSLINSREGEIGAITFISALIDFQMRVGLLIFMSYV